MNKLITGAVAGFMLFTASTAWAGSVTIPNTFSASTPAVAAEVNANFTAVKTAVDDNDSRITINAGNIGTNATDIGTNATDIGTNATDIGTNATDIGTNATGIATNAGSISTLSAATQVRSVSIPASQLRVPGTNPATQDANGNWGFSPTLLNGVIAEFQIPSDRAPGTDISITLLWYSANTTPNRMARWEFYFDAMQAGEAYVAEPASFLAGYDLADSTVANGLNEDLALTITGGSALVADADALASFQVVRVGGHVNDTLTNDAVMVGVRIDYTANVF